jgi:hypothetical protein
VRTEIPMLRFSAGSLSDIEAISPPP